MFSKKVTVSLLAAIIGISLLAAPVLAQGGSEHHAHGDRPGYGYGDPNHNHTGPPGLSGERPGWGYGDTNRVHTGPPGLNK